MSKPFILQGQNWDIAPQQICRVAAAAYTSAEETAERAMRLIARMTGQGLASCERRRADWWNADDDAVAPNASLRGKTLGLVGDDASAAALARRARDEYGMTIVVLDDAAPNGIEAARADSLNTLLSASDFVSLHCADDPRNRHIISGPQLDQMKPGGQLLNVSHARLVNEHALSQALMFELIGGAGIAFSQGAPEICAKLLQCENLVTLQDKPTGAPLPKYFGVDAQLRTVGEASHPGDRLI